MTGAVTPESGRIMSSSSSGIVAVRGPIQPVTPGQLVLLQFHQRFDLISCRGHSRGWGRWRHCRIAWSRSGITSRITSGWLIVRASARVRAGARQFSEIQRDGCSLNYSTGKIGWQFRFSIIQLCQLSFWQNLTSLAQHKVTGILSKISLSLL